MSPGRKYIFSILDGLDGYENLNNLEFGGVIDKLDAIVAQLHI
jgi:hypothetical protein